MAQDEATTWLSQTATTGSMTFKFGIMSSLTYPDARPAILVGDRVLNLSVLAKWGGFSQLKVIQPHLDVFNQSDLAAYATLPCEVRAEVRQYLHDMLVKDGPYAAALQDKLLVRAAVIFPVSDVALRPPFRADRLDATVL
ncbi:hypothetical protein LTR99_001103 [Exophiala xenobiotica]|uniref:Fumarylacetoacetase N-terminal domain-containing protein n=1 Tax=Vermiconidia calcicola TaxID=1690605 RepID=A0AAV9QQ65_9PEZI|nr:hypothetical protein LTR92_001535 [Exophiala xenobiotica]KAK5545665.1 hypothetical protein LTR25_000673 [Vermiconidia calcicola]KAK5550075.1 hypothetical protein LTR23_000368 [Chaetothyriales sp. CCFEE 6169]KAK5271740.1 hypothetical protein LTR96_003567 [Exophiala xenobiotica]KAK5308130.1 hypothetical protein LTR99_001103 [Exophiala xenobiotica]